MEWMLLKVGEGVSYVCQLLAGQSQVFVVGVMVGGVIGNQLFDLNNDSGSPATGDAIVYVVVALAVSTISLAAVAVCKKIKEN